MGRVISVDLADVCQQGSHLLGFTYCAGPCMDASMQFPEAIVEILT